MARNTTPSLYQGHPKRSSFVRTSFNLEGMLYRLCQRLQDTPDVDLEKEFQDTHKWFIQKQARMEKIKQNKFNNLIYAIKEGASLVERLSLYMGFLLAPGIDKSDKELFESQLSCIKRQLEEIYVDNTKLDEIMIDDYRKDGTLPSMQDLY